MKKMSSIKDFYKEKSPFYSHVKKMFKIILILL